MGHESRRNPLSFPTSGVPIIGQGPSLLAGVLDAYGRELVEGDVVHLQTLQKQAFIVESIRPIILPGAPPGLMEVKLVAHAGFHAARGQRHLEFVRLMTAIERDKTQQQGVDASPEEAAAPVPEAADE